MLENAFGIKLNDAFARIYILDSYSNQVLEDAMYEQTLMKEFEQGKINPFRIEVENKWNTRIEEVFATVSITDAGTLITDFKTVSVDTKPWEIKNITGYFDTTNLEAKRYTAKIILSYDGATTSKLVAIYVHEPSSKTYMNYIIIASIVAILIFTIFIYLIWKVNKLSNQNGKKK